MFLISGNELANSRKFITKYIYFYNYDRLKTIAYDKWWLTGQYKSQLENMTLTITLSLKAQIIARAIPVQSKGKKKKKKRLRKSWLCTGKVKSRTILLPTQSDCHHGAVLSDQKSHAFSGHPSTVGGKRVVCATVSPFARHLQWDTVAFTQVAAALLDTSGYSS